MKLTNSSLMEAKAFDLLLCVLVIFFLDIVMNCVVQSYFSARECL